MSMELKVGDKYMETVIFSGEQVKQFSELSGDMNPIHTNAEYAANTSFKKCIVPGILACSIFSKMIATSFPGTGSVYLDQSVSFKNPVYPNEDCTAIITVLDKRTTSKGRLIYKMRLLLTNKEGQILIEGTTTVLN